MSGFATLLLAVVVTAELGRAVARARRRVRMNRAMHELRRPLQSLSLALQADRTDFAAAASWMDQQRDALEQLDEVINGRTRTPARVEVSLAEIADALERRWRREGVRVDAPIAGPVLQADPRRLGAALDNLVANAVGHGGGDVTIRTSTASGVARLEVRDRGGSEWPAAEPGVGDRRHGHGLAVAAGIAASHGGALIPPRRTHDGGTVAALALPLTEPRGDG